MGIKTGRVVEVIPARSWDGPHGTVYYSKIQFDNGDVGEIGKKSENAVRIGDVITYTIDAGQYGNKIKEVRDNNGGGSPASGNGNGGGRSWPTEAEKWPSFSLAYAKDTVVGMLSTGNEKLKGMSSEQVAQATIAIADKYLDWLKSHQA